MAKPQPSSGPMPLTATRRPALGDAMEIVGDGDPQAISVTHVKGQFIWLGSAQLRFHVKDDLISTQGGDAWRIPASGAAVRFATGLSG